MADKFLSADRTDLVIVTTDGVVRLVCSQTGKKILQPRLPSGYIAAASGDINGDGRAELALQTKRQVTLYRLEENAQKLISLRSPKGQSALVMGDVNGDDKADWRGDRRPNLLSDAHPGAGPEGQVSFFFTDRNFREPITGMSGLFIVQSTAYKDYNGDG